MNDQVREFTLPVAVWRFRAETSVFGVQNERYCTSTSVLWNMCKKFQPDPASARTPAPAGLLSASNSRQNQASIIWGTACHHARSFGIQRGTLRRYSSYDSPNCRRSVGSS